MDSTNLATLTTVIGLLAGSCTTFSFIPQVVRIWRKRSAKDISAAMFSVFSLGAFFWLIYGILVVGWPIIVANGITLLLSLSVLVLKWRFSD